MRSKTLPGPGWTHLTYLLFDGAHLRLARLEHGCARPQASLEVSEAPLARLALLGRAPQSRAVLRKAPLGSLKLRRCLSDLGLRVQKVGW